MSLYTPPTYGRSEHRDSVFSPDFYVPDSPRQPFHRPNIVKVNIKKSVDLVVPIVQRFRENANFTEIGYSQMLRAMCKVCGIPKYKANRPQFLYDPTITIGHWAKVNYISNIQFKHLIISGLYQLKGFLGVWYLYLRDRNSGFERDKENFRDLRDFPGRGKNFPENQYADRILCLSEPRKVRRLKERTHIEIVEL